MLCIPDYGFQCRFLIQVPFFTVADGLFSAHITGNFVVFAYKLSNRPQLRDFINLTGFPVLY